MHYFRVTTIPAYFIKASIAFSMSIDASENGAFQCAINCRIRMEGWELLGGLGRAVSGGQGGEVTLASSNLGQSLNSCDKIIFKAA
jgi:hypothetical protein